MTSPSAKRKATEELDQYNDGLHNLEAKKARLNAAVKPKIDMAVLEKAKKALELQKQLKDKLAKLQTTAAKPSQISKAPLAPGSAPSTALVLEKTEVEELFESRFFDPTLGDREYKKLQRRPRSTLTFLDEGSMQRIAHGGGARLDGRQGPHQIQDVSHMGDPNLIPLGQMASVEEKLPPIPDVEWWDARILVNKAKYENPLKIKENRITALVEHPEPLEPPIEVPPPAPQPLKLTKKELKKMRTQRRMAREQEKQDLIRQGLLEPPAPKVKISNLMRVLGAEATADPTAIEAEVRKQMAERQAAHEDRNLARKLTPAERREKKTQKIIGRTDGVLGHHIAVYKVGDLTDPQLRFKVDINAKENHITGCAVGGDGFWIVVVEGAPKPLSRYEKLMLRRIDWNKKVDGDGEEEEGDVMYEEKQQQPNYCHLVWQGVVATPHFKKFRVENSVGGAAARKFLGDHGVLHYYELCEAYAPS